MIFCSLSLGMLLDGQIRSAVSSFAFGTLASQGWASTSGGCYEALGNEAYSENARQVHSLVRLQSFSVGFSPKRPLTTSMHKVYGGPLQAWGFSWLTSMVKSTLNFSHTLYRFDVWYIYIYCFPLCVVHTHIFTPSNWFVNIQIYESTHVLDPIL